MTGDESYNIMVVEYTLIHVFHMIYMYHDVAVTDLSSSLSKKESSPAKLTLMIKNHYMLTYVLATY